MTDTSAPTRWDARTRVRVANAALFAAAALSFALPFLAVHEERRARATGIELMTGRAHFSGAYVHPAYTGDVELIIHRAKPWAIAAEVLIVAAGLLALGSEGRAGWATLLTGGLGALTLGLFWQVTTLSYLHPERPYGYWLSVVFTLAGVALAGLRLRGFYSQWRL